MVSRVIHQWNLKSLTNLIIKTVNNRFDFVVVIEGNRGCLTEDTLIKTPQGIKKIKDINDIDILTSYDFKQKKEKDMVAIKIDKGVKDVYEIKTEDGNVIKATLDHIFYVKRKNKIIEIPLREIVKGDKLIKTH